MKGSFRPLSVDVKLILVSASHYVKTSHANGIVWGSIKWLFRGTSKWPRRSGAIWPVSLWIPAPQSPGSSAAPASFFGTAKLGLD